jgi:hypothetical protein
LPAAAHAGLHFIENQENAMAIAQLAQAGQKPIGWHDVAALALNRFDQDRGDFAGWHIANE